MLRHIPYGRQTIDETDIEAVCRVLRSDWLTTGPGVAEFEGQFSRATSSPHTVAVSSGTAALHAAIYAAGISHGDEVIVPALTFAASANAAVYQGAKPVFCEVSADTLLIDPADVARRITQRTKAIVAVDYAGQPCDYTALREIADRHALVLIADACHSLGAAYNGQPVGSLADLTAFSFHPVKHITTGEGGMTTCADSDLSLRLRRFRNHGIDTDHRTRATKGTWFYSMEDLGYNYRLTDFQCALGVSQLSRLGGWVRRRQEIAERYDGAFAGSAALSPLRKAENRSHAFHLYVISLADPGRRAHVFDTLRTLGIGANVHYIPVHLHPFYQREFGTRSGDLPVTESAYEGILSLPMYPGLSDEDVDYVAECVLRAVSS